LCARRAEQFAFVHLTRPAAAESGESIDELRGMAAAAQAEARLIAERNAELLKRIDRLNQRIAAHMEDLERRRREGG
jgi:uncharacterized protein (DUF3084 family)